MKEYLILYLKGLVIGIGKVIPGVSGSIIAISLGLYEKCVYAISHIFNDLWKNIIFLSSIGLGIITSIIIGSNLISILLDNYYNQTMFLFIGLISGVIPILYSKVENKNIYYYFKVATVIIILLIILNLNNFSKFIFMGSLKDYITIFIIGFIDALAMVIPGISGTSIFIIMGYYDFILEIFSSIPNILFNSPSIIITFGAGTVIGIFIFSYIMDVLMRKHSNITYTIITGFVMVSIYYLLINTISKISNIFELIVCLILLIVGYIISKKLE